MLDIGFSKLMIVGGLALIVIGPERLPRVARTMGTLLGRAQRYVAEVKSEVNRSMELEELQRAKRQFEEAASGVQQTVAAGFEHAKSEVDEAYAAARSHHEESNWGDAAGLGNPPPAYQPPRKNWRLKRGATPMWFKQKQGVRRQVQSGAARVARFRPRRPGVSS